MLEARRPLRRLFFWLLAVLLVSATSQAVGPATTTISDVVYRADDCLNASIWAKSTMPAQEAK